jgi:heptosyltransferase-3
LKHQYKTEVIWKKLTQKFIDFFVDLYAKIFVKNKKLKDYSDPDKILFIILAQLGDALVMSYVFPFIHDRFPNSKIDVLCGEWTRPILENNPYINKLIFFNHIRMNRSDRSMWGKLVSHIRSSHSALKYIRLQKYDLSIEGGVTHPNGNILSYRGEVKRRIGFGSGGFGSLLTDEVIFPEHKNFHILEAVLEELQIIGINKQLNNIRPYFKISEAYDYKDLSITALLDLKTPFVILHPESGNKKRMMSRNFWLQVVKRIISKSNYNIIICGLKKESSELAEFLLSNVPGSNNRIIDTVQKLSLDEFSYLSIKSTASFTVESLAAHFCSMHSRTLAFYNNGYGRYFFPISKRCVTVIHNHLPSKELLSTPICNSFYVQNFEDEKTYVIVDKFLSQEI